MVLTSLASTELRTYRWKAITTRPPGNCPPSAAVGIGDTPREALDNARDRACMWLPELSLSQDFETWLGSLTVERVIDGHDPFLPPLAPAHEPAPCQPCPLVLLLSAPSGPRVPPSLNSSVESEGPEGADSPSSGLPAFIAVSPDWTVVGWGDSPDGARLDALVTCESTDLLAVYQLAPTSPALAAGEAA